MNIKLEANSNMEVVKYYLSTLYMFHGLTKMELTLMEILVDKYLEYKPKLKTDKDTFKWIFSKTSKAEYRDAMGIKQQRFVNLLYSLRKKKILIGDTINKRLIPVIKDKQVKVNYTIVLK